MSFVPKLFIGVGELVCFFTLRETCLKVYQGSLELSSFHHFNLSQDPDEAFEKASRAAESMAMELTTTRAGLRDEMNAITRASAEELARRERAYEERHARWAAEKAEEEERWREIIRGGSFAFGRYHGLKFAEAPRGYLTWLIDSVATFEEGSLMQFTAQEVVRQAQPGWALPKPDPILLLGAQKERLTLDVTVVSVRTFLRDRFNGCGREMVYVVTMVDRATRACLLSISTAFAPKEGAELLIKGTVKDHSKYRGQAQTVLQRIVKVK